MNGALQIGVGVLAQSSLLLLLGLLVGGLLRRRGPEVRAFIYQVTLAGVVLGALLSVGVAGRVRPVWQVHLPMKAAIERPAREAALPAPNSGGAGAAHHLASQGPPTVGGFGAETEGQTGDRSAWVYGMLAGLWAVGTGLLLLWLVVCQWHLVQLRRGSRVIAEGPTAEALARLCAPLGIRPPLLLVSPHVRSPFLAGITRPAILLPSTWETDFDDATLSVVLAHETAHLARWDCAWTLLLRLTCAVLWMQPLLWLLARQMEQAAEEACDLLALTPDCSPRRYADCLLSLAERILPSPAERTLGAGVVPVRSSLGRRIQNILDRRDQAMSALSPRLRAAVTLGTITLALAALRLVSAAATPSDPQTERAKAYQLTSVSNLRQVGLAILVYAQDHGGHLPDADRWMDEIIPYLVPADITGPERQRDIASLLHDPSAPAGQTWSYAFNRALSGLSLSQIKEPTNVVTVFESTGGGKNANDEGESLPHPGWHSGQVDICFADGRVKSLRSPDGLDSAIFQPAELQSVSCIPVSGYLFDRRTHKPLVGVSVDFYTLDSSKNSSPPQVSIFGSSREPSPTRFSTFTDTRGEFHSYLYPAANFLIVANLKGHETTRFDFSLGQTGKFISIRSIVIRDSQGKIVGPLSSDAYTATVTVPDGYGVQTITGQAGTTYVPVRIINGASVPLK